MGYNKKLNGVGFSNSMLFYMLLNISQRKYVLGRSENDVYLFIKGLSSCEIPENYFNKFKSEYEKKNDKDLQDQVLKVIITRAYNTGFNRALEEAVIKDKKMLKQKNLAQLLKGFNL